MAAHAELRAATAGDHEAVDAAFARFDLNDPADYAGFLMAHARALPAIEAALSGFPTLPPMRPRRALLADDLARLGYPMPVAVEFTIPHDIATAFGTAYVVEGSRLGGGLLARRVGPGLPTAYLAAVHQPGEWRAFSQALDHAAGEAGAEWLDRSIAAARAVFRIYARAAGD